MHLIHNQEGKWWAACKVAGAYCNEATGWCGLTEAHMIGSTGAYDCYYNAGGLNGVLSRPFIIRGFNYPCIIIIN